MHSTTGLAEANQKRARDARERAAYSLEADTFDEALARYSEGRNLRNPAEALCANVSHDPDLKRRYRELRKPWRPEVRQLARQRAMEKRTAQAEERAEILAENLAFLADNGVMHVEVPARLGKDWADIRRLLRSHGRSEVGDRLVQNTYRRLSRTDLETYWSDVA